MRGENLSEALRRWSRYPYTLAQPYEGTSQAGPTPQGPGQLRSEAGPTPQEPGQPREAPRSFSSFTLSPIFRTPFGRLALLHGLSSSGDALVAVALAGSVFFSVSAKAAQSRVALSLALTVAPFAIVGPLLGPLVERVRGGRRAVALASVAGRSVLCLFMAFSVHSLLLFPLAFFLLVLSKLYLVTKAALVPSTVTSKQQLVLANSKLAVGGSVAGTLAGVIGAGIFEVFSSATVLRIAMGVYVVGAWAAARLLPAPQQALAEVAGPTRTSGLATTVLAPPRPGLPPGGIQLAAVTTGALRFCSGFVTLLLLFTFRRHSADVIWYGLALGASQVGNVLGALIAPRLREHAREEWMLTGSALVVGAASLLAGLVHWGTHWFVAVLLAAGIGLAAGSGKLAFDSMVQRDLPSRVRGRSFARFESAFQLLWAIGALLAVLITMPLADGFVTIGFIGLLGAAAFAWGAERARQGQLPAWFPGAVPAPERPEGPGRRYPPAPPAAAGDPADVGARHRVGAPHPR
jgi:MFS family permease